MDAQPNQTPENPLPGVWRGGPFVVCCGTIRVFRVDIDTNPAPEFVEQLIAWVVSRLNGDAESRAVAAEAALELEQDTVRVMGNLLKAVGDVYGVTEPEKLVDTVRQAQAQAERYLALLDRCHGHFGELDGVSWSDESEFQHSSYSDLAEDVQSALTAAQPTGSGAETDLQ